MRTAPVMTTSVATGTSAPDAVNEVAGRRVGTLDDAARMRRVHWCLRIGAAACFIGHGAFGVITKAAWVPYFAVAGIPAESAYALMPVVGTLDILMGIAVLQSPRPMVLLYMVAWSVWTALLRPLAGEPVFETLERAGNYGVPLALLLLVGWPRSGRAWLRTSEAVPTGRATIARVLQWTTAVLLFGHGGLAAISEKTHFASHYATLGLPGTMAPIVGWAEMIVSVIIMVLPNPSLLIAIATWKISTEALFPLAGSPIWEFIERAGSYAAPLALALLTIRADASPNTLRGRSP